MAGIKVYQMLEAYMIYIQCYISQCLKGQDIVDLL